MGEDMDKRLETAYLELLAEHGRIALAVARLYTPANEDAADLEQEIRLQWWRALPGFAGRAKASTWMYQVALYTALTFLRLPNDHTTGLGRGSHSPRSMVADNDYAVGQLIDTLSRSPIWESTAVFILEDDAQAGEDHVDAHRSPVIVVSPWAKHGYISCVLYSMSSICQAPWSGLNQARS
jgi:DNA-directed RNA polymerase specialized sigma24 family protein